MKYLKNIFKMLLIFLLILTISGIGYGYFAYKHTISSYPIEQTIASLRSNENYTSSQHISATFLDAIVAIEDHRFYDHGAVDFIGMGRAFITNFISGNIEQGGSTITQQLAKNLFLDQTQSLERKFKEIFLAHELEKLYSKDEILELYVNVIYYGDGNTGITMASQNYFNKLPSELTFNEATLLAGLPQAPSAYALSSHYDAAVKRQTQVISALISFIDDYKHLTNLDTP